MSKAIQYQCRCCDKIIKLEPELVDCDRRTHGGFQHDWVPVEQLEESRMWKWRQELMPRNCDKCSASLESSQVRDILRLLKHYRGDCNRVRRRIKQATDILNAPN